MMNSITAQQSGMVNAQMIGQPQNNRILGDDVNYLQSLSQPMQIPMGNSLSLPRNTMMTYQRNPMGISVSAYGDGSMNHAMTAEEMMSNSIQGIVYNQQDNMITHASIMQNDMGVNSMIDMNQAVDVYGSSQLDMQPNPLYEIHTTDVDNRIKLRQPKRTMSAYSCFSHTIFRSVRDEMGEQPSQSDVFRVIANRWKGMSSEEKKPYVDTASKDRDRYKTEMQRYHKLRREVEKNVSKMGSSLPFGQFKSSRFLNSAFRNHDYLRIAQILLNANNCNSKDTYDMVCEASKIIAMNGLNLIEEQKMLGASYTITGPDYHLSNDKKPFKCHFKGCNKEFGWKSNLNVHLPTHDLTRKRTFVCTFPGCGKAFYDSQHLKQHHWIHTRNPEGFQCSQPGCDKKYATHSGLQLHIRGHHKNDRKFICPYENCTRAFVRNNDLSLHIMRMHKQNKPYHCNFEGCTKAFVSGSELKRHLTTHNQYTGIQQNNMISALSNDITHMEL